MLTIDYPNIKINVSIGAPNESVKMLHVGEIDMIVDLKDAIVHGEVGAITLNEKFATFATKKLLEYMKK